jgi:hypothetical protein
MDASSKRWVKNTYKGRYHQPIQVRKLRGCWMIENNPQENENKLPERAAGNTKRHTLQFARPPEGWQG